MSVKLSLAAALAVAGLLVTSVGAADAAPKTPSPTGAPAGQAAKTRAAKTKQPHAPRPETHIHHISQHVRVSPAPGQSARAYAYIRPVKNGSRVSVEGRGLQPGQNYTLKTDTAPRCGPGTMATVATLKSGAARTDGRVATPRDQLRSIALLNGSGQTVACGTVRRHKA